AINKKNTNIINYLIDQGADINIKNTDGDTPLIIATKKNYMECCEKLISNDVDVHCKDISGNTPLMIAIKNENYGLTQLLIGNSCINDENKLGETPLYLSIIHNSIEIRNLLIKHGANIN
ncbi:ankyrin, partial [Anaeromyces robustus]